MRLSIPAHCSKTKTIKTTLIRVSLSTIIIINYQIIASVNSCNTNSNQENNYLCKITKHPGSDYNSKDYSHSNLADNYDKDLHEHLNYIKEQQVFQDLPYTVSNTNNYNNQEEDFFEFNKNKESDLLNPNWNLVNNLKSKDVLIHQSIQPMQLPVIYFGLMAFVIGYMILVFLPPFYTVAVKSYLYVNKFNIYHFSEHLYRSNIMVKLILLIALVIFSSITFNIFCLIRQRIAVPELQKLRFMNKIFLCLSFLINLSTVLLTFLYYPIIDFTENKLGLCDNILFLVLMVLSYIYCNVSLELIKEIKISNRDHNVSVLKFKKILVIGIFAIIISCKSFY